MIKRTRVSKGLVSFAVIDGTLMFTLHTFRDIIGFQQMSFYGRVLLSESAEMNI